MATAERRKEIYRQIDAILDYRQPVVAIVSYYRDQLERQDRNRVEIRKILSDEQNESIVTDGIKKCEELKERIQQLLEISDRTPEEEEELKRSQEVLEYTENDNDFFAMARRQLVEHARFWIDKIKATRREYLIAIQNYRERMAENTELMQRLLRELPDENVQRNLKKRYLDLIRHVFQKPNVEYRGAAAENEIDRAIDEVRDAEDLE